MLFVNLDMLLCDVLICYVGVCVLEISVLGDDFCLLGCLIDECVIVNVIVMLMVIGGLINYMIYWIVVVCVVGIVLIWDDMD